MRSETMAMAEADWLAAMGRIKELTGTKTQVQLAEVLNVRQSSVSEAKRRYSIPTEWQLKLLNTHGVLPVWLMTGTGPMMVAEATPARIAQMEQLLAHTQYALASMKQTIDQAIRMAGMTNEELVGHKRDAAVDLQKASDDLLVLSANLAQCAASTGASHAQ